MQPPVIAITGPSGAGKSTFARALQSLLCRQFATADIAIVAEDSYYRDQSHLTPSERLLTNYDHPDALEHSLLLAHLQALQSGVAVQLPVYDYTQHNRRPTTLHQAPAQALIVEGILLFSNAELLRLFDLRVYVHTPLAQCLQRRISRDIRERGRTQSAVEAQFEQSVIPMYQQYQNVWLQQADVVIDGLAAPEAALMPMLEKLNSLFPRTT